MNAYSMIVRSKVLLAVLFFISIQCANSWGQAIHPQDSMGLINFMATNCTSCSPPYDSLIGAWLTGSSDQGVSVEFGQDSFMQLRVIALELDTHKLTDILRIDSFPMLEELIVVENELQGIASETCPRSLRTLHCENNNLALIPPLFKSTNLEELKLNNNRLDSIPRLDSCFALGSIECSQNSLTRLPKLNHLDNLWFLDCSWNQIDSLPTIDSLFGLNWLIAAHNTLREIPRISSSTFLIEVDFSNNQLDSLPNFDQNEYLFEVNLENNNLSSLPNFAITQNLEILNASGNNLTSFPMVEGMDSIKNLYLDSNLFDSILTIPNLPKLSMLGLNGNKIESLHFDTILPALSHLNISKNWITEIPPPTESPNLSHFICDSNYLAIPKLYAYALEIIPANFVYAPQREISIGLPDSILTFIGDSITFISTNLGMPTSDFKWLILNESSIFSYDSVCGYKTQEGELLFQCIVSDSMLPKLESRTIPVRVTAVKPNTFDPDKDGKRDLYDMIPIALWYLENGVPRRSVTPPEDTTYTLAYDWKGNFISINGKTVNLKEVDTNGDGLIDITDFGCIREYYQRLEGNSSLVSVIKGDTVELQAIPQFHLITVDSLGKITVPFRIEVVRLPNNVESIDLRGLIFTRGIIEDSLAVVDSIYADLPSSEWANDTENVIGAQFYFPDANLGYFHGQGSECDSFPAFKLDVCAIRTDTSKLVHVGDAVIVCVVTEDLKLDPITGFPTRPILPILGNISNLMLLVQGQGGNIELYSSSCLNDSSYILIDSLLGLTTIRGNVYTHYDSIIPNVLVRSFSSGTPDSIFNDSLGQYLLEVTYGIPLVTLASKEIDCSVYKSIDENDLLILKNAIRNPAGLNVWQSLACDIDENGLIDINDYILLRDFWNGRISDFPGHGAWLFIPSDSIPDGPYPFDYSTNRFYENTERTEDQDFIGLLKGDVNFSWVPDCKIEYDNFSVSRNQIVLSAYPNPAEDYIIFTFSNPQKLRAQIEIFDSKGSKVISHGENQSSPFLESGVWQWDRSDKYGNHIAAGMFYAKLSCKGQIAYRRFVLVP